MEEYTRGANASVGVEVLVLREHYEPALERALSRLPATYRRLIQPLTSDACLSYEDVIKAMGVPIGSIGPMRMRCLQMLRRDAGVTQGGSRFSVQSPASD